jgi:hypothetical protein
MAGSAELKTTPAELLDLFLDTAAHGAFSKSRHGNYGVDARDIQPKLLATAAVLTKVAAENGQESGSDDGAD